MKNKMIVILALILGSLVGIAIVFGVAYIVTAGEPPTLKNVVIQYFYMYFGNINENGVDKHVYSRNNNAFPDSMRVVNIHDGHTHTVWYYPNKSIRK